MINQQQERAVRNAFEAVEDLDLALLTARTPADMEWVRARVEEIIANLVITATVAKTLLESERR